MQSVRPHRVKPRIVRQYHDNGQLSEELHMIGNKLNGPHRIYAEDGVSPLASSTFRRGKLHGDSITWHPTGHLAQRLQFADGILHGVLEEFDPTGRITYRAHFCKGVQHGVTMVFGEDGTPAVVVQYADGAMVGEMEYNGPLTDPAALAEAEACDHCGHTH